MRLALVRTVTISEYTRRVRQRGFLLSALLVPLLIVAGAIVAGFVATSAESISKPIAVVDLSGVLGAAEPLPDQGDTTFILYPDADAATTAVREGAVDAAFVVSADYLTTRRVTSYSPGDLPSEAASSFSRYLEWNAAAQLPDQVRRRAIEPLRLTALTLDGRRSFSEDSWPNLVIPYVAAILFFVTVISSASNAVRAVVDEKESRTMEILVTSVSPNELMAGKIAALFVLGLTQLVAWSVAAAVAFLVARTRVAALRHVQYGLVLPGAGICHVSARLLPHRRAIGGCRRHHHRPTRGPAVGHHSDLAIRTACHAVLHPSVPTQ